MSEQTLNPPQSQPQSLPPTVIGGLPLRGEFVLRLYPGPIVLVATALLVAAMLWGYFATERRVSLHVNGAPLEWRTHQQTIAALLDEQRVRLTADDIILPPPDTRLERAPSIQIWLAQPVEVEADGLLLRGLTQSGSVADALRELGVHLGRDDRLLYGGEPLPVQTLLLDLLADPLDPYQERPAVRLSVERAMPITISDDGVLASLNTYATTVREALRVHNVLWHNTDRITPGLDDPINAGLHILVERSKPMTIIADGKTLPARTRAPTIAQALPEAGIYLKGKDYTLPPASTATRDNMLVQVVRVREDLIEEASPIAYAKLMQPDDNLEIDQQRLAQRGQAGEHRRAIRIVYENGQEIKRTLEREWDARAPVPQITAYGHKIVVRDLMTPGGPIQYWRVIRMYATSYSPSRSGVSPSKSWYGHTFSGLMAGKGVVAIDKSVVPWLADLYVPGYGTAIAGDTGSGIIGKWIDLGYDDDNYESWSQWVNVYLLTPAPPAQFIRWILPNTPVEFRSRQ